MYKTKESKNIENIISIGLRYSHLIAHYQSQSKQQVSRGNQINLKSNLNSESETSLFEDSKPPNQE